MLGYYSSPQSRLLCLLLVLVHPHFMRFLGLSPRKGKMNLSLHRPSFHMVKNYLHSGWDLLLY